MANDPSDPVAPAAGPPEGKPHAGEPGPWAPTAAEPQRGIGEQVAATQPPTGSPAGPQHRAADDEPVDPTAGAHHQDPAADATAQLDRPSGQPGSDDGRQDTVPGGWPVTDRGAAGGWQPAPTAGTGHEGRSGQPWASPAGWAPSGPRPDDDRPGAGGPGQQGQGWYGPPGAGRPPEHPIGTPLYPPPGNGDPRYAGPGGGFGPHHPGTRYPDAPPPNGQGGRSRRGGLLALGLVAMLLTGVIGGVVGNTLAAAGRNGSVGVLGQPLPGIDEAPAPTTPVEAVAARVLPSVVQLRVEGPTSTGEGSAMVLSADGLLLTNNHVVEAAAQTGTVTAVFQDGRTVPALIVGRDPSSDLALIRAQNVSELVPVELGNSDSLRVGQQVVAFGAPLGLGGTVTTGIISAVDRAVNVGEETGANTPTVLNALQTDAAINPGNSGGPLVDMQGRVVGINSAIATTGAQGGSIGVGFSIPVNQARRVAEELERTGRASRAVLGVTVSDDPQQAGAVIRDVVPGGAADLAGIRPRDVVLRFGDQRISTGTDLQAAVGSRAPGEVVEVQLADRTVQATLTAAPN